MRNQYDEQRGDNRRDQNADQQDFSDRSNYRYQDYDRDDTSRANYGYQNRDNYWSGTSDTNRYPQSFDYGTQRYGGYGSGYTAGTGTSRSYGNSQYESSSHPGFMERMGEKVGRFFGKGPKGYQRSDGRIQEDVSEALYSHSWIDASEVEVAVLDGVVTLSGTVTERRMKRLIEDETERVSGVKDIHNNIRVASTSGASSANRGAVPSSNTSQRKQ